jgi:hypothetical protein
MSNSREEDPAWLTALQRFVATIPGSLCALYSLWLCRFSDAFLCYHGEAALVAACGGELQYPSPSSRRLDFIIKNTMADSLNVQR